MNKQNALCIISNELNYSEFIYGERELKAFDYRPKFAQKLTKRREIKIPKLGFFHYSSANN